jgi:hypothetical protein
MSRGERALRDSIAMRIRVGINVDNEAKRNGAGPIASRRGRHRG